MAAVTELSSVDDLARIRQTWKTLWDQTTDASFFQSWDWMRSCFRTADPEHTLRVLVVTDGNTPIGIVPLVQQNVRTRMGVARLLRYPPGIQGTTFGPIGLETGEALSAALKHTLHGRDWSALELASIDEMGSDAGRTRTALSSCRLRPDETARIEHPIIEFDESWDWFLEERTVDFRETVEAAERELSQYGPISFYRWRPAGDLVGETNRRWDLFEIFEQVRGATEESTKRTELEMAVLKDAHPAAVDAGAVEICLLSIGGNSIACSYGYHRGGTVEQVFLAGLPQVETAQTVLLGRIIRDSFMRNDRRMLFSNPDESVRPWCNGALSTVTLSHFDRLSPQARLLKKQLAASPA